jgi:hypothetical protein
MTPQCPTCTAVADAARSQPSRAVLTEIAEAACSGDALSDAHVQQLAVALLQAYDELDAERSQRVDAQGQVRQLMLRQAIEQTPEWLDVLRKAP